MADSLTPDPIETSRQKPERVRKFRTPKWFKWLVRHPRLKDGFARFVGFYLAMVYRTTRWDFVGLENLAPTTHEKTPGLVCFWHERLPMMSMLAIEAQRLGASMRTYVLVSGHNDGRFIGQAVGRFNLGTVIGSSSKGGATSLRNMLLLLREGSNIAITPDGPRGPAKVAAAGVAQLAAATGAPIYAASAQCRFHMRMPSWDRMILPFPIPFSRGVIVVEPAFTVPRANWAEHLPAVVSALNEASAKADRLCGIKPSADTSSDKPS
ncbi:DUF374 domain-containing protein [Acidisoma cellulosilytica]|uniref:DUF374 domain-containing protein n=1 Tax=Acidisoma cellulosilyticum TaxID=2802395 RepID=A0A963YXP0_9PROT|nr:DUF374 domain-containing protein [Acidisoma cellulosilyticum]MCB8879127.1 DUF374 domain-containing protein [Acidisoma cellulosilyticum]